MDTQINSSSNGFDRVNAIIAIFVFLFTLIIYKLTVAPTLSYWDCGEFIASAYILGIPHPPGSPVFIVLGRLFSMIPFATDICYRINLLSVVSSSFTALFGYLVVVRIVRLWYKPGEFIGWKRIIGYIGGIIGSLFMAFSLTNWSNSVETEVYGLSMMLLTIIFWLALQYYENNGTQKGSRLAILICFLAMLGVGIHLTTFLI
ncbi:MAG: DUF2723 domain-containing protein, partial [candidate division Zixibacteria bacterium]|nr:DUF2723 domain-containing protein [candidate division Zixibacteria bacterium]